ncbi:hypothetical protein MAR_017746, partial [Mya arenaria]
EPETAGTISFDEFVEGSSEYEMSDSDDFDDDSDDADPCSVSLTYPVKPCSVSLTYPVKPCSISLTFPVKPCSVSLTYPVKPCSVSLTYPFKPCPVSPTYPTKQCSGHTWNFRERHQVDHLSSIGGSSVKAMSKRVMKAVMKNSAVKRNFPSSDNSVTEYFIKDWLRNARDRDGGRQKRMKHSDTSILMPNVQEQYDEYSN